MRLVPSTLICILAATAPLGACSDDDAKECSGNTCPGSPGAPAFAGVRTVAPDRTGGRARITWAPATDDKTPPAEIRYRVYVSTSAGRATARTPVLTTEPGATSAYVSIAPLGATHHVAVRAVDADDLEDGNTVEKSVLSTGDTTPPTFGGAKTTRPEPGAGITVSWDAATDDRTAPEAIRYAVHAESSATPPLALVEGKTEATIRSGFRPGETKRFIVVATDAADNAAGGTTIVEGTVGSDVAPPTFAGCSTVDPLGSTLVRVSWSIAGDDVADAAPTSYEIFSATTPGGQNFATPAAKVTGQTSVIVRGLDASTQYHFVCRARDAAGNTDTNTVEKSVQTRSNVTPPTFAGATASFDPAARKVLLTWTAATDDATAADKIVYAVYEAPMAQAFDFTSPRAVSPPGATSIELANLPSSTALHWIVRARDEDYNEDTNTVESAGTTFTSFSLDVTPIFNDNCAVVGCHVAAQSAGGLSLSSFNAYDNIVGVNSLQRPLQQRVAPNDSANSYLYQKITLAPPAISGNSMPAPGTGNVVSDATKEIVKTWIDQGAPRN